jgi:hypothetical protein
MAVSDSETKYRFERTLVQPAGLEKAGREKINHQYFDVLYVEERSSFSAFLLIHSVVFDFFSVTDSHGATADVILQGTFGTSPTDALKGPTET